ncbi:hypothetical protein [Streptomyces sp. NPDC055210]
MARTHAVLPASLTTLTALTTALDSPVWITVVCLALALLVLALNTVFPQDSVHRLQWWQDRRSHQRRRRNRNQR